MSVTGERMSQQDGRGWSSRVTAAPGHGEDPTRVVLRCVSEGLTEVGDRLRVLTGIVCAVSILTVVLLTALLVVSLVV